MLAINMAFGHSLGNVTSFSYQSLMPAFFSGRHTKV